MNEYLEIGQIVNSYGLKGFVKVIPFTDNIDRFFELRNVYINYKHKLEKLEIEEVQISKSIVQLKFKGLDNINDIEKYKNCYLKIEKKDAVKLPEDTYFIVDLIGIDVIEEFSKNKLGKIIDVFKTGSNDVYVVKQEDGKELLLPAIADVIKNVDIENKTMTVNLIEGLI